MSAEVVKLVPDTVGDGFRFEVRDILDVASEAGLVDAIVIGIDADGDLYVSSNINGGQSLVLIERAKRLIVFGEDS